jgi:hypothetical protein
VKGFTYCTVDPAHFQGCSAGFEAATCQQCRAPMRYEEVCRHGFPLGKRPNNTPDCVTSQYSKSE